MSHQKLINSDGQTNYDSISIKNGGFEGHNQEESAEAIGLIHKGMLGRPNGIAYLGPNGTLPEYMLDGSEDINAVTVNGPASINLNASGTYVITNYHFLTTYVVTALSGAVSIVKDTITYTAPDTGTVAGFIVNGTTINLVLNNSSIVSKPSIVTPSISTFQTLLGPNVSFVTSNFSVSSGTDLHEFTDWQIALDPSFAPAVIVKHSTGSSVNKTTWTVTSLPLDKNLYLRVRFKGNLKGYSLWSNIISFRTKSKYVPDRPKILSPTKDSGQHGLSVIVTSSPYSFPNSTATLKSVVFELWSNSVTNGTLLSTVNNDMSLSKTFNTLEINKGYVVRVRHISSDDNVSEWSEGITFLTVDSVAPTKPVITAPANNITNASSFVEINWTPFQGKLGDVSSGTELQLKLNTDTAFPTTGTMVAANINSSIIGPLLPNTSYNIRIKHIGATGGSSDWSNILNIKTIVSFISAPVISTNGVSNHGPLYEAHTDNYSGEGTLALTEWKVKDNVTNVSVNYTIDSTSTWLSATPDRLLKENRNFTITARRKNSLNNWSPWSDPVEIYSVQRYLAKPINTLLANAIVNRRSILPMYQYDWNSDIVYTLTTYTPNRLTGSSVSSYEYQFSNDATDAIFSTNTASVTRSTPNTTISVTVKPKSYMDLDGNERFRLFVRARELMTYANTTKDILGTNVQLVSEWSDIKSFNVLSPYSYREISSYMYGYYEYIAPSYYPRTAKVVAVSEETKRVAYLSTNYSPGDLPGTASYTQEFINKIDIFKIDAEGVLSLEFSIVPPSNSHVRHSFGDKCLFNNDASLLFIKVTPTAPEGGGFANGYICVFRRTDNIWSHTYDIYSTESQTFAADMAISNNGTRLFVTSQSKGVARYSNGDYGIVTIVYDITSMSYTKLFTIPINIDTTIRETYFDIELYSCGDNAFAVKSKTNNTLNSEKKHDVYYYYYNGSTWVATNTNFGTNFVSTINLPRVKFEFTGFNGNTSNANLYKIDATGSNVILTSYYLELDGGSLSGGRFRLISSKTLGPVISNGLSYNFTIGKDGRIFISDIGARRLRVIDYSTALSEYKEYENFSYKTGIDTVSNLVFLNSLDCFFARQHGIVSSNEIRANDIILIYKNIG